MILSIISDIHGNFPAFRAVMDVISSRVEKMLFLGDLCGYYPFVEECIGIWDEKQIIGVRGNHDQIFIDCMESGREPDAEYEKKYGSALKRSLDDASERARHIIMSMPQYRKIVFGDVTIGMYHGAPWDPLEGRVYPDFKDLERFGDVDVDIVLLGHTHYPMKLTYKDKLIVNPGSIGQPRDRILSASYALLNTHSGEVEHQRIEYDPHVIIEDAKKNDPDNRYLVEVLKSYE
ncbi:MAG: metallophosphoesterase family protein [Deltaproteobacteria bacterium]|nr:metallophosphoesterase family protein [Candidatus Zymogenaceae bacterium]